MPKTRIVLVTLELITDTPLPKLKNRQAWQDWFRSDNDEETIVRQVHAQVAQPPKPGKGVGR